MGRAAFIKTTVAALFTGGLDLWSPPDPGMATVIRVLLSADPRRETPQPADGGIFTFAGKRWRGTPAVVALPGGGTGIVASVPLDAYLYGVVPAETPARWNAAALQAQAIVARTYALGRRTPARPYDVVITAADQRFGGIDAEDPATNAAVDATAGVVVRFGAANAEVAYAACCGGHTADAALVWGHRGAPYLRGIVDPYCINAPDYRWERRSPLERVARAFGARVRDPIVGFALAQPAGDGRPPALDVLTPGGSVAVPTVDVRRDMGDAIVRSTWLFSVKLDAGGAEPAVTFAGAGHGHGVGLCQWGARAMADAGATAAQILGFYFPGTTLAVTG